MAGLCVIAPAKRGGVSLGQCMRRLGRIGQAVIAATALGLAHPRAAPAADLPLADQPYSYTVLDQDLRDALRQLGANNGLRVSLSDGVQGRIRGRLGTLTPRAFLDRLAADFGFDWFYDGFTLYVSAVGESVNRLVPTNGATPSQLDDALKALGVADARFAVRPLPGQNLAMVAGPPRFVELVQQAAAALAPKDEPKPPAAAAPAGARPVTVFRGREEQKVSVSND